MSPRLSRMRCCAMLRDGVSPHFFHGLSPATRADRIALAPLHVQTEPGAADHAGKRMMTRPPGFLRVVSACRILLFAVSHVDAGIPIGHRVLRDRLMDHLLGGSKPSLDSRGVELLAEPAKRIHCPPAGRNLKSSSSSPTGRTNDSLGFFFKRRKYKHLRRPSSIPTADYRVIRAIHTRCRELHRMLIYEISF
jgi:hypothetical protein